VPDRHLTPARRSGLARAHRRLAKLQLRTNHRHALRRGIAIGIAVSHVGWLLAWAVGRLV
jgi:uncharacterized protein (DUF2062 family)